MLIRNGNQITDVFVKHIAKYKLIAEIIKIKQNKDAVSRCSLAKIYLFLFMKQGI